MIRKKDEFEKMFFFVSSKEGRGLERRRDIIEYSNTTRDAKIFIFKTVIFPFLMFQYLISDHHNRIFKIFLILVVSYVNYKLPHYHSKIQFTNVIFGHRISENEGVVENSLEALDYELEKGTRGFELDIQLTKDNEIVIFHDIMSIKRVCQLPPGWKKSKFRTRVSTMTLDELKKCRFKHTTMKEGTKEETITIGTIPTFEEFVKSIEHQVKGDQSVKLMVEVKEYAKPNIMAKRLKTVYQKYPFLYESSFVASFNPVFLYRLRKIEDKVVTCMLSHKRIFTEALYDKNPKLQKKKRLSMFAKIFFKMFDNLFYFAGTNLVVLKFLGVQIVSVNKDIDEKSLKKFQKRGYQIICWTVDNKKDKERLEKLNVGIVVDKPTEYVKKENEENNK